MVVLKPNLNCLNRNLQTWTKIGCSVRELCGPRGIETTFSLVVLPKIFLGSVFFLGHTVRIIWQMQLCSLDYRGFQSL